MNFKFRQFKIYLILSFVLGAFAVQGQIRPIKKKPNKAPSKVNTPTKTSPVQLNKAPNKIVKKQLLAQVEIKAPDASKPLNRAKITTGFFVNREQKAFILSSSGGGMGFTYDARTKTLKQNLMFNNTSGYTLISDRTGAGTVITFNKKGSAGRKLYNPMNNRYFSLPNPPGKMNWGSNHKHEQMFANSHLFQLRYLNNDKTNTVLVYIDAFKGTQWSSLPISSRANEALKKFKIGLANANPKVKITSLARIGNVTFAFAEHGSALYVVKLNLNITNSGVTLGQAEVTAELDKHPSVRYSLFVNSNKMYVSTFVNGKFSLTSTLSHQGKVIDKASKRIQELMKDGKVRTNNNMVLSSGRILYALNGNTYTINTDPSKMYFNGAIHDFSIVEKNGKYFFQVLK